VGKRPPEAIELPDHQHIAVAQGFQAGDQTRPIITAAGSAILIDVALFDTDGAQVVVLQVEGLGAIGFGNASVSDQHVS